MCHRTRGVHPAKRRPVVHDHASANHVAATVDCSGLRVIARAVQERDRRMRKKNTDEQSNNRRKRKKWAGGWNTYYKWDL